MKKYLILLLAAVLLLAAGCELRNRQPSANFIPATHAPETTHGAGESKATEAETEPSVERTLTRHSVRTVVSETGSYTDHFGTQQSYEFTLPFVDFPSEDVAACNDEIESVYNKAIKEQKKLIEAQEPLDVYYVTYSCYYTGEMVSLNLYMVHTDGTMDRSVYCFRDDGTMATNAEILAASWVDETEFMSRVYDYLQQKYVELNEADSHNVTYSKYYDMTVQQADDLEGLSIYADEDYNIHVLANMYTADGGVSQIEFKVDMK